MFTVKRTIYFAHDVRSSQLYIGSIGIYSRNFSGIIRVHIYKSNFFTINTICIADKNIFFVIIIHIFANHSENSCCPHRTGVSVGNNFVKILCSLSRLKYIFVVRLKADPVSLRIILLSIYFRLQ